MESKPTPSEGTPLAGDYGPMVEAAIFDLMMACWYRERDNAKRCLAQLRDAIQECDVASFASGREQGQSEGER